MWAALETMGRSDTAGEMRRESPTVTEDSNEISRCLRLHPCFSSWSLSAVAVFCVGLMSGAGGGLLLGVTAVVVVQALELLADNTLLMDRLENYMMGFHTSEANEGKLEKSSDGNVLNTYLSVLVKDFGVFSFIVSLPVGISIGLSTYALVISKYGDAAVGKALALAGPVCLMSVTAIGLILGFALKAFLSVMSSVNAPMWFYISLSLMLLLLLLFLSFVVLLLPTFCRIIRYTNYITPFIVSLLSPMAVDSTMALNLHFKTKLYIMVSLIPLIFGASLSKIPCDLQLNASSVPLMLIITDIFNMAGQPIITLQSPTSTNSSSAVPEAIFIGILTSQLLTVTVGMSLFLLWHRSGAGRICATAAGSGAAVLSIIKWALPALGPGASIGAVMGVTGAVGVSLSAAATATDRYAKLIDRYELVGKLGVAVGAGVGAFLSSCAHSGLSGVFMGLCATMIPVGLYLKHGVLLRLQNVRHYSCLFVIALVSLLYFGGSFLCIALYSHNQLKSSPTRTTIN